jgi:hypothetical protein
MIYELRTYQLVRQNIGVFLDRFRAHTVAKFHQHGIELVGCWMTEIGDGPELVLLLAFPELGARQRSFAALEADEEFAAARAADDATHGPSVVRLRNSILIPTDFSPLS